MLIAHNHISLPQIIRHLIDQTWPVPAVAHHGISWQIAYLDSLVAGFPTGNLVVRNADYRYEILDGHDRCCTLYRAFALGQFNWTLSGCVSCLERYGSTLSLRAMFDTVEFLQWRDTRSEPPASRCCG